MFFFILRILDALLPTAPLRLFLWWQHSALTAGYELTLLLCRLLSMCCHACTCVAAHQPQHPLHDHTNDSSTLAYQQQQLQHMLQHGTPQQQEHARQVMAQLQKQREAQAAAALQVCCFVDL